MRKVEIVEVIGKDLTARERVKIKDTAAMVKLDEATKTGDVIITPEFWAVLNITSDEYDPREAFVVADKDGTMYYTGSTAFMASFTEINDEMAGEEYQIRVYRAPSKKREGKDFITCTIV